MTLPKLTRSSSELKAIITEVINNEDFKSIVIKHVCESYANVLDEKIQDIMQSLNNNNNDVKTLKEENCALKETILVLQNEISTLKAKKDRNCAKTEKPNTIESQVILKAPCTIQEEGTVASTSAERRESPLNSEQSTPQVREDESNEPFIPVRSRRKAGQRPSQIIGSSHQDRSGGILSGAAQPQMAWFYVGRIKNPQATVEDWQNYLKEENDKAKFIVEKLETKGQYLAFKIGAPFRLLHKLSNEDFWPPGVSVRRFNFWPTKKQNEGHFLETPNIQQQRK